MTIFNLIKKTPFLLILTIIILLSIFNQKQFTRLKILIWKTPSLSLGNYLAISSSTGFILSYIITSNLAKNKKLNSKNEIKYKINDDNEENNLNQFEDLNKEVNNEFSYDNNFIERDVKEPSPTINASFRIISNTNRKRESPQQNQYNSAYLSDESDNKYYEEEFKYNDKKMENRILNDWEDDSYTKW